MATGGWRLSTSGADTPAGESQIRKEMGLGAADFLAALPRLLADYDWHGEDGLVQARCGHRELLIWYGPEGWRAIASVRLPTLPVTLVFRGFSEAERRSFLAHFDRRFRRGGG